MKENQLVTQHNYLIEGQYKLSLQEKRVVLWLISKIQMDEKNFQIQKLSIREFCNISNVSSKNMYHEIKKITQSMISKLLLVKNTTENTLTQMSWLSSAKYFYREGLVELRFSSELKPFLLSMKNQFTTISLDEIFKLKSVYSVRVYELLKQYEKIKKRTISVTDFRKFLGISDNEYKLYGHFKSRVLLSSQKEICEKTDLSFEFSEIKIGKKVAGIIFQIKKNKSIKKPKIYDFLIKRGFSPTFSSNVLDQYSEKEVKDALKVFDSYGEKIKYPVQFFKKSLEEGYGFSAPQEESISKCKVEINKINKINESEECKAIRKRILSEVGEKTYISWFERLMLDLNGGVLTVSSNSRFISEYVETNFCSTIQFCAKHVSVVRFS